MILSLFRKNPSLDNARTVYAAIISQARDPYFFTEPAASADTGFGAPDTVEGRFEILTLHMYAALRRFKRQGNEAHKFSQTLFDTFFNNMDDSLREMGVGDMSIGRKIRKMAESFYGRVAAYEKAFDSGDESALNEAIARNVYGDDDQAKGAPLAEYLRNLVAALESQELNSLMSGKVSFPTPNETKVPDAVS